MHILFYLRFPSNDIKSDWENLFPQKKLMRGCKVKSLFFFKKKTSPQDRHVSVPPNKHKQNNKFYRLTNPAVNNTPIQ